MNGACQLSSCFQQGFDHPAPLSFIVGLVIVIVVLAAVWRVLR
jgi:hypothetical protein